MSAPTAASAVGAAAASTGDGLSGSSTATAAREQPPVSGAGGGAGADEGPTKATMPVHDAAASSGSSVVTTIEACPKVTLTGTARLLLIGDIHGCLDELKAILKKAMYMPSNGDVVVLVGDLVCKGPASADVVRYCRENNFLCKRCSSDPPRPRANVCLLILPIALTLQ